MGRSGELSFYQHFSAEWPLELIRATEDVLRRVAARIEATREVSIKPVRWYFENARGWNLKQTETSLCGRLELF